PRSHASSWRGSSTASSVDDDTIHRTPIVRAATQFFHALRFGGFGLVVVANRLSLDPNGCIVRYIGDLGAELGDGHPTVFLPTHQPLPLPDWRRARHGRCRRLSRLR